MTNINFEDLYPLTWKPKLEAKFIGYNKHLVRMLYDDNKIWFAATDLDKLRGLKSNASNTTWIRQNREAERIHYMDVSKPDLAGTMSMGLISRNTTFIDEELAKNILSYSTASGAKSAYKEFINGPLQKAKIKQNFLISVTSR